MYITNFIALAVTLAPTTFAYPDPEPCTGNCSAIHDPSVIRRSEDGKYFRFNTNGDIGINTATNITGPWTYEGALLPEGSVISDQQVWAPDVSLVNGTYYAYYCVSLVGTQESDIGVATSTTLDVGTWEDHGSIGVPNSTAYNRIDPNFFKESDNATAYFTFGSAWDGIFQTELEATYVDATSQQPEQKVYNSTLPGTGGTTPSLVEGGYLFWWENTEGEKWYYYFFSSGACCNAADALADAGDEYKIMVCRSDSVDGSYVDQNDNDCAQDNGGTLVLGSHGDVYAPGGQGVLYEEELGRPIVYYHYVNTSIGYGTEDFQFGFNYLDFSTGWPVVSS